MEQSSLILFTSGFTLLLLAAWFLWPGVGLLAGLRSWRTARERRQVEDALKYLFSRQQEGHGTSIDALGASLGYPLGELTTFAKAEVVKLDERCQGFTELRMLLIVGHGWTLLTAINLMLFSLLYNPCATTIMTIYRETKSVKWATLSVVITLGLAFLVTFATASLARLLGWV